MDTLQRLRDDIAKMRADRDAIDKQLAELETAEKVLARYAPQHGEASSPTLRYRIATLRTNMAEAATKAARVMQAVAAHISEHGPTHTDVLHRLDAVAAEGMTIEQLSTTLSRYKDQFGIQADRRNGWSLKSSVENPGATNTGGSDLQPTP